jgi:hypothetical protein
MRIVSVGTAFSCASISAAVITKALKDSSWIVGKTFDYDPFDGLVGGDFT